MNVPLVGKGLLRVSDGYKVSISATDDTERLVDAIDVFKSIDARILESEQGEIVSEPTEETEVDVYEMSLWSATFGDLFRSLSIDLDTLCLKEAQIKHFVREQMNWLSIEIYDLFIYPTSFLFKKNSKFYVANVSEAPVTVGVYSYVFKLVIFRFDSGHMCRSFNCHRVVVPKNR